MSEKESATYRKLIRERKKRAEESAYGPAKKSKNFQGKPGGGQGQGGKPKPNYDREQIKDVVAAVLAAQQGNSFDPYASAGRGGGGGGRNFNHGGGGGNQGYRKNNYGGGGYNNQGGGNNAGPANTPNNG